MKHKRNSETVLFIEVTKDKYELPIAVADSALELAKLRNVPVRTIYRYIANKRGRFYKVVMPSE